MLRRTVRRSVLAYLWLWYTAGSLGQRMTAASKWAEIFIDIVSYELSHSSDGQLLSEGCDKWIARHPVSARVCIISAGLLLTAHLANLIEPEHDPLSTKFFIWKKLRQL